MLFLLFLLWRLNSGPSRSGFSLYLTMLSLYRSGLKGFEEYITVGLTGTVIAIRTGKSIVVVRTCSGTRIFNSEEFFDAPSAPPFVQPTVTR